MKFKDCIGKKIVRAKGVDTPDCGVKSDCYIVLTEQKEAHENWYPRKTYQLVDDELVKAWDKAWVSWDDGYWELYEPEEKVKVVKKNCTDCNKYEIGGANCRIWLEGCGDKIYLTCGEADFSPCDEDETLNEITGDNMRQKRIVNIIVADQNDCVSLKDTMLHHECNVVTDKTDEEIWFDIKLDKLIKDQNVKRTKIKDSAGDSLCDLTMDNVFRDIQVVKALN